MVQVGEWRCHSASAQAWGSSGIALFRTSGVVTPGAAAFLLTACQGAVDAWQTRGLVAQYTDAQLDIDADALCRSALGVVGAHGRLALPTALIVRRDDLPLWQTYAQLMANRGIVRGVFTDYDDGMRWARRQAEIFTADRLDRRTPASGQ